MEGYWKGEGLGGMCDEMWTPAASGSMLGTFRLMKDDKLQFSEFFMLVEEDGSLVLKLKHFDPQLNGWEAKDKFVRFPLIKVEGQTAFFSGLTYQLDEDDVLRVFVAIKQKDGSQKEGKFTYRK